MRLKLSDLTLPICAIGIDNGTIRLRVNATPVRVFRPHRSASAIDDGATCRLTLTLNQLYLSLREQLKTKDAQITDCRTTSRRSARKE